jgi:hypothetical protein
VHLGILHDLNGHLEKAVLVREYEDETNQARINSFLLLENNKKCRGTEQKPPPRQKPLRQKPPNNEMMNFIGSRRSLKF